MKEVTTASWKGNLMREFLLSIMTLSHGLILGAHLNEVYTSYFSVGTTKIFFDLSEQTTLTIFHKSYLTGMTPLIMVANVHVN